MSHMGHILIFLFFLKNDSQLAFTCENKFYINKAFEETRFKFLCFKETNRPTKAGHTDHKLWFGSILVECF